ncbi:hypothetical protein FQN54_006068 [Arachnomyces sp. PD_36]|nr:hypothetical protein FQN54_006068 [Arachnomyces sp. PD_36]
MKLAIISQLLLAALPALGAVPRATDDDQDLYVQAGSHVIYSYPGLTPSPHILNLTRQGKVGGIILFGENVDENLIDVVASFQQAYEESPAYQGNPLFIMTDQEGPTVARVPGGPNMTAKEIGLSPHPPDAAEIAGEQAGKALKALNINTNLAPVLGVSREEGDFLDSAERSYGNNSQTVSNCGWFFSIRQREQGVISTAKHFPGLGATFKNTDEEAVTIDLTRDKIRTVDEYPYREIIDAGIEMVMPSWAIYPDLDPKMPAGLSKSIIQGELRQWMGFEGVTITDAIEALSLAKFGNHAELGLMATLAGMDLLLASGRNETQGEAIVEALVEGVKGGTLSKDEFDAGTERILALQSKLTF